MMTSSEKLGKSERKANDFAVYIPDNVLSHILVSVDTTIRVFLLCRNAFPMTPHKSTPRHVLCNGANGFRYTCV